jgi:hypothetical protein
MSNTKAMPSVVGGHDVESVRLGTGAYAWKVGPSHVDLSMPTKEPLPATISPSRKTSPSTSPARP